MSWRGESSAATRYNSSKIVEVNHMPTSSDIHFCSGFKRRRICLPFLPKEIIFKILLCLPVDVLYNVMRYVCREWCNIIKDPTFIDAHLQESPTGFLMYFPGEKCSSLYLEMREHGVETTDLSWALKDRKGFNWLQPPSQSLRYKKTRCRFKFPGLVLASCNGLVLVSDMNFFNCFHVANLILRQWVSLPPLIGKELFRLNAGLGYADSCKAYKVAYTYYSDAQHYCAILTLGVDKAWRVIAHGNRMSCIPPEALEPHIFMAQAHSTGGYIHWVSRLYVLSLEIEKESFHASVVPSDCRDKPKHFFATESFLCLAGWEKYIFELWALVDVETEHWKKLLKMDVTAQIPVVEQRFGLSRFLICPVALLNNGELFILRLSLQKRFFMICNVKTGAIDYFEADSCDTVHIPQHTVPLVRSLVSPKWRRK